MTRNHWRVAVWTSIAVALGAIAVLTVWRVLGHRERMGASVPNVTDWMQGWGSLAALLVGSAAAIAAAAVYHQGKGVARAAEDRWHADRTEASKDAPRAVLVVDVRPRIETTELSELVVDVRNFGSQPIQRVNCRTTLKKPPNLLAADSPRPFIAPNELATLNWRPPGGGTIDMMWPETPGWDLQRDSDWWSVTLRFEDATGQAWERVDNGEPVKVPTSDLP